MHSHHVVVTHPIKKDHNKDSGLEYHRLQPLHSNDMVLHTKKMKTVKLYLRRTFEGAQVQRNSTEVCEWFQHVAPCGAAAAFNTPNNPVTH